MAVAFKTALGTAVGTSAGATTLVLTTTAAIAVGDLVVVRASADSQTASAPTFTCADSGGNSYTVHVQRLQGATATAGAGVGGAVMCAKATTAVATGGTITLTVSSSLVTNRAFYAESFTGVENTVRSAAVGAGAATGNATVTSGTVNSGDLVIGAIAVETRASATGDADTTNGAWSTIVNLPSSTGGSDATRVLVAGQYKIATASGAQTYNTTNTSVDWNSFIVVLQATADPAITQAAYRWYGEGTESGATALANQDTVVVGDISNGDATGTLRIRLQSTTAVAVPATDDFQLQYEKNTSGTWINVSAVTTNVSTYDSPNLTNAAATTSRLTGGTGSFVAGKVSEDSLMDDLGWGGNNFTELVYALKVKAADVVATDTLRFRVLRNGATATMTYSVTPTISIIQTFAYNETGRSVTIAATVTPVDTYTPAPPTPAFQEGFRWRNDDGSQTAATWKAAQDTNASLEIGQAARLRLVVDTTEVVEDFLPTLYYKKSTDSTWVPVPVGSGGGAPVYVATSSFIATSGEDTTTLLTPPAGKTTTDFSVGRMWDDENGADLVSIDSLFLPTNLSGLGGWYDASNTASLTLTGGGTTVSNWNDLSGNARHLMSWTGLADPPRTGAQNGLPYISFRADVTKVFIDTGGFPSFDNNSTVFAVARTINTTVRAGYMAFGHTYMSHTGYSHVGGATKYSTLFEYGSGVMESGSELVNQWSVQALIQNAGTATLRRDGMAAASGSFTFGAGTSCMIGGGWTGAGYRGDHDIAELIFYSRVLSAIEIALVEQYLRTKWAVEIDPLALPWVSAWWTGGREMAALGLTDSAAMSAWPDEVGTKDMVQATPANQPTYRTSVARLNNRAGITPNGTSHYMTLTATAVPAPYSFVVICAPADAWAGYSVWSQTFPGAGVSIPVSNHVGAISGTAGVYVGYWGNYNARLFSFYAASGSLAYGSVDDLPNPSGTLASYWEMAANPTWVFVDRNVNAATHLRDPIAFIGIAAGDIRSHPGWREFVKWSYDYYATPDAKLTPDQLPGLQLWFDPSDAATVTSSGGLVTQWNDKSGNNRSVTASGIERPLIGGTMNGRSVIKFDGSTFLTGSSMQLVNATTGEWTAFAAVRNTSGVGTRVVIHQDGSPRVARFLQYNTLAPNAIAFNTAGTSFTDTTGSVAGVGIAAVCSAIRTATTVEVFLGNAALTASVATTGTPQTAPFVFKIAGYASNNWIGDVAEIVIYNRALSPQERTSIEQYLIDKWLPTYNEDRPILVHAATYLTLDRLNGGANGVVWSPIHTPSLAAWFDATVASSFSYSTGNDPGDPGSKYVSQWRDLSGQENHANANANAGYHPKRSVTINGLTAVDCSTGYIAQHKSLGVTTLHVSRTKPSTYIMVLQMPSTLIANGTFIGSFSNGYTLRAATNGSLEVLVPGTASIGSTAAGVVAPSTTYVLTCSYSPTGQFTIRRNGALVHIGVGNYNVGSSGFLYIGAQNDSGTNGFAGYLGEVLVYTDTIAPANVVAVENYLMTKWGITSSATNTPTAITGLQAWYDASDGSTFSYSSGSVVSQWNDKSGNGRHVAQSTVINQPNRNGTQNGLSTVIFDGNDDTLSPISAYTLNQPLTICMVMAKRPYPWLNTVGGSGFHIYSVSGPTAGQLYMDAGVQQSTNLRYTEFDSNSDVHVWALTFNGASSAAYRDGVVGALAGSPGTGGTTTGISIGDGNHWGAMCEVIVYDRVLTTIERQTVETYLRDKWATP